MRILFVTNHLQGNDGTSRYSRDIVTEMQKRGHDLFCLVHKNSDMVGVRQDVVLNTPLSQLANPFAVFKTALSLKKTCIDFQPDIVHFCVEPYAHALFFYSPNSHTVLTVHGTYAFIPALLTGIRKKMAFVFSRAVYSRIDEVISVSTFTKEYLLKSLSNAKMRLQEEVTVIKNGIDLSTIFSHRKQARSENKVKEILFVGSVKERKGLLEALEALHAYKKVGGDFFYRVVGLYDEKDPYYQKLRDFIKSHELSENVFFEGRASEEGLHELYEQADLFLMLSKNSGREFEGFGLVYIEANAYGVPVIGPNDSGAREAISDDISGYVVDPNNKENVVEKIGDILERGSIKKNDCIEWARLHNIKGKVDKLLEVYAPLIEEA